MLQMADAGGRCATRTGRPSRKAPPPRTAVYVSPSTGAWTAPATGRPASTSATETPTIGKPWRKLAVPSRGSTTHHRSPRLPPPSSPKKAMPGASLASASRTVSSLRRSTSLT